MANIIVSTTDLGVNVAQTTANITITDTESNVIVANLATAVANVAVTTTELSINVDQTAIVSNSAVRTKIFVSNLSGFGNLAYDSSAESNGIIQYTGTSNADILSVVDDNPANITQHLSVVDTGGDGSLSYVNTTGVFTYTGPSAAEVRAHISSLDNGGDGSMSYNPTTGIIEYTGPSAAEARAHISSVDTGGDGSLGYNPASGIITYSGPSAAEVRAHLSNTSPITYNASTGVIGLEQTLDDLTLVKYQETIVDSGNVSGTATFEITAGTVHTANIVGTVTNIVLANISAGGSATLFLKQDAVGARVLDSANFTGNWKFLNNNTTIDPTSSATSVVNVFYDGTIYTAAVVDYVAGNNTDYIAQGNVLLHRYLRAEEYGPSQLLTTNFLDVDDGSSSTGITSNTNGSVYAVKQPAIALPERVPFVFTANSSVSHERFDGSFFPGQMNITIGDRLLTKAAIWAKDSDTGTPRVITNSALMGSPPSVDGINVLNQMQPDYLDASPFTGVGLGFMNGSSNEHANVHTAFLTFPKADPGPTPEYTGALRITNAGGVVSGVIVNSPHINLTTVGNNRTIADKANIRVSIGTIDTDASNLLLVDGSIGSRGDVTATGNVNAAIINTTSNAYIGANLNVAGNLEVTGNINYREVEDLLVRDQTITLNFGNASAQTSQIIVDRAGSGFANTDVKWNETTDRWQFTNDGTTYFNLTESTTDVAEGTNLYYTDGRADARVNLQTGVNLDLSSKSTTDLAEGTNLYYTDARADARVNLQTGTNLDLSSKSTTDLAEGTNLYYTDARSQAALSVTTATASGDGALSYNDTSGVFTFTPADAEASRYGDANVITLLGAYGNAIVSNADITTSGVVETRTNVQPVTLVDNGFIVKQSSGSTGDSANVYSVPRISTYKGGPNTDWDTGTITESTANTMISAFNSDSARYRDIFVFPPYGTGAIAQGITNLPATAIVSSIGTPFDANGVFSGGYVKSNASLAPGTISFRTTQESVATSLINDNDNRFYSNMTSTEKATVAFLDSQFHIGTEETNQSYSFPKLPGTTDQVLKLDSNFDLQWANAIGNALVDVNSITPESNIKALTVKGAFGADNIEIDMANITSDGYAVFPGNQYTPTARGSYSGAANLVYHNIEGSTVSGSTTLTISAIRDGGTLVVGTLAGLNTGYIISSYFPNDAYVTSIDSGAGTVEMSQPAFSTNTFAYAQNIDLTPAIVDTTTGLVVATPSVLEQDGTGSYTTLKFTLPRNVKYGYPESGFAPSDFDIFAVGISSEYTLDDDTGFTQARSKISAANSVINAPTGITIGADTDLSNRAENDVFRSFGLNMMWSGTEGVTDNIQPAIVAKSYTQGTLQEYAPNIGSGATRLFFTTANGQATDDPFTTYPRINQELGRLSFWGTTGTQITPSSYNVPAYTSVQAADDWDTWGGGVAGNTNVYMASTANGVNADTYLSYKGGELFLGSGNSKPITLAPAAMVDGAAPQNAYAGAVTTWANANYANTSINNGAKFTVTNGESQGAGQVGDMELAIFRNDVTNGGSNVSVLNNYYAGSDNFYASLSINPGPVLLYGAQFGVSVDLTGLSDGQLATFSGYTGTLGTEINGNAYYVKIFAGSPPVNAPLYGQYGIALYDDEALTTPTTLTSSTDDYGTGGAMEWLVAPSVTDREWKFSLAEQSEDLVFSSNDVTKLTFTDTTSIFSSSVRFQNLTTTEINALASPQAGDTVFNTTIADICFYDGTAWQKVNKATM